MKPYYEQDGITIYHGDCREIAPALRCDLLLADPPYGIGYTSNHNTRHKDGEWGRWVRDENFAPIYGDEEPFDPAPYLHHPLIALFGGNYFASRLSDSRCWITWDKREDVAPDRTADCEYVWTNFDRPSRIYRHLWRGLQRRGEENVARSPKLHPHQKPVALLRWLIEYSEVRSGGVVLDTHMGSGSTLVAARDLGHPAIGIEISEAFCEVAAKRLSQGVLDFGGAA